MKHDAFDFDMVRRIFQSARSMSIEDRAGLLDAECGDNVALRREVESLLSHIDDPLPVIDEVSSEASTTGIPTPAASNHEAPRHTFGEYELLDVLGEGGMGTVYRARQKNPDRVVALKVIRPGYASREMLARFRHEAQVLGRLQHPGIAQIFAAGSVDSGAGAQPFFAMELVEGKPIDQHVLTKNCTIVNRLRLMVRVAEAVHYAHVKGIIHRDLKPANILVAEGTSSIVGMTSTASSTLSAIGQPKVLDFGVARLTDSDLRSTTLQTTAGQLLGTVPYMSPEQVSGHSDEVDVRSDVYALGVITFELLTDRLPHDLDRKSIPEAARIIRDEDPLPLGRLNRHFRGDLETIVMKALEKDQRRRYQSAFEFAADIERYLGDQPILARPATTFYQFRKFASRNRALVWGVAASFILLAAGVLGTTVGMLRAQQSARRTQTALDESLVVQQFLTDLLTSPNPRLQGRDVMVRDVLDQAAESVERRFADRPLVEARLRMALGSAYAGLGDYAGAASHLQRCWELRRDNEGERKRSTVHAQRLLGEYLLGAGDLDAASQTISAAFELAQSAFGSDDPDAQRTGQSMGRLLYRQGKLEEAAEILENIVAQQRVAVSTAEQPRRMGVTGSLLEVTGERPEDFLIASMQILSAVYNSQSRIDEAQPLIEEVIERSLAANGPDHPTTLMAKNNLGAHYFRIGRRDLAIDLFREVFEGDVRTLGESHPETLVAMNNYAQTCLSLGRFDEGESLLRTLMQLDIERFGEEDSRLGSVYTGLAYCAIQRGSVEESESWYRKAIDLYQKSFGPTQSRTLSTMVNLAAMLADHDRAEEAEPLLKQVLQSQRTTQGERSVGVASTLRRLAVIFRRSGRLDESEAAIRESLEIQRELLGEGHIETIDSLEQLGLLELDAKRYDVAEKTLRQALALAEANLSTDDSRLPRIRMAVGRVLLTSQQFEDAEALLEKSYQEMSRINGAEHRDTYTTVEALIELYDAWGRADDARRYRAIMPPDDEDAPSNESE